MLLPIASTVKLLATKIAPFIKTKINFNAAQCILENALFVKIDVIGTFTKMQISLLNMKKRKNLLILINNLNSILMPNQEKRRQNNILIKFWKKLKIKDKK